jgi:F420-dependent oxidoreductase-like protein
MKVGLQIPDFSTPRGPEALGRELANVARTADDAGFEYIAVMDHFFQIPGVGATEKEMLEAYTTLGYLAACTSRASLLTVITGAFYREPGILGKIVTTLDVLSGGRAWLGIGAGWNEEESRGLGIRFPPLSERFERLEETLQICLQMWRGDEKPYEGSHYSLERPLNSPQSLSRPHPPIMIGGGGRRVLTYAGREADIVSINTVPFAPRTDDGLTPQEEAVRRFDYVTAAAGSRVGDLDIESSPYFVSITDDSERGYARIGAKTGIAPEILRDHPNVLVGSADAITETLRARREAYGVNYVTVQQTQAERFAPIVARLTGT